MIGLLVFQCIDWSLFLLRSTPFLETGSFSLLATSSRSKIVSLLKVVVGMGVPLIGVLKALVILTYRFLAISSLQAFIKACVSHHYRPV